MLFPEVTASLVGTAVGAVGAAARWFSEIMQGRAQWVVMHFVFIIVMGSFMGFMGTALAEATEEAQWANVFSGALGASGAFGFDMMVKRVARLTGL